jgi:hypothetical protein
MLNLSFVESRRHSGPKLNSPEKFNPKTLLSNMKFNQNTFIQAVYYIMPVQQMLLSLSTEERDRPIVVCLTMLQQRIWRAEQNLIYIHFSWQIRIKWNADVLAKPMQGMLIDETKNYCHQQARIANILPFTNDTILLCHDVYTYH